jgi:hypothetical protein
LLSKTVFAKTHPAFSGLLADDEGNLWVRMYHVADRFEGEAGRDRSGTVWNVFDSDGKWLTDVAADPGLTIMDVRERRIAGTSRDESGVLRIRVHRLTPPGSGSP